MKNTARLVISALIMILCAAAPAAAQVVYDNGPIVTCPGCGSGGADVSELQTALGMSTYGYRAELFNNTLVDDFTVPGGWVISDAVFYGFQVGSTTTSTVTELRFQIYDGPPGAGGNVIYGDLNTNVMTGTDWAGIYRTTDTNLLDVSRPVMWVQSALPSPLYLSRGTYWIEWWMVGSLGSGPWVPPVTVLGSTGTGNALWWNGLSWLPLPLDVGPQDLSFTFGGAACPSASFDPATGALTIPELQVTGVSKSFSVALNRLPVSGYSFQMASAGKLPWTCPSATFDPATGVLDIPSLGIAGTTKVYAVTMMKVPGPGYIFDLTAASK